MEQTSAPCFVARGHRFPLTRPYIMGILNVTPDSFSDGGRYLSRDAALRRAREIEEQGADIIDIGGQSTRPGYEKISPEQEWQRLSDVLPALLKETRLLVSVDTFYPQVAEKALDLGVHIINDVTGFSDDMLRVAAPSGCGCVVMCPAGGGADIFAQVRGFFEERRAAALGAGIPPERLCFDPGIGFGKSYEENLKLIAQAGRVRLPGSALLMAASRKRVTGAPCGNPPFEKRLPATLAAHTAALLSGADIVRVHDVAEGLQAAQMAFALRQAGACCGGALG